MKKSLLLLALLAALPAHAAKSKYSYYRVGNAADVATATLPGTVLMGGGTDVDAAFQWLCARAGNGDFLVIRATGTDAYNPYVQQLCPNANSVATLIIPSAAAANDPFVAQAIAGAEALWIAGGDQSDYIKQWTGTPVQAAINAHVASGKPIGGTSAGMDVLTQYVYSALGSKGVTSSEALADPYDRYVTLARDFAAIPHLEHAIGDTHFVTRDRMGRNVAFLCRIAVAGWDSTPRAIDVDEQTALLVDGNGALTVTGSGSAYFLQAPGPAETCQPKTPVTYRNIDVYRINSTGTFDLDRWRGTQGTAYQLSAISGALTSTLPGGAIY